MQNQGQKGQVLLIVFLVMIVALTVGLSIAARVVTELKLSKQNEESQRAFQAAEAGIQQALEKQGPISNEVTLNNSSTFSTTFGSVGGANTLSLNNGVEVDQLTGADVWLSKYATDATIYTDKMGGGANVTINMYWGKPGQNCSALSGANVPAAIEIALLTGDKTSPVIEKRVFDPCSPPRITPISANLSGTVTSGNYNTIVSGNTYIYFASFSFTNGLIMKVLPIFNSTAVAMVATSPLGVVFKPQGADIESTGKSGDTARKVRYFQSYPQMPVEVFPYSIMSQ